MRQLTITGDGGLRQWIFTGREAIARLRGPVDAHASLRGRRLRPPHCKMIQEPQCPYAHPLDKVILNPNLEVLGGACPGAPEAGRPISRAAVAPDHRDLS